MIKILHEDARVIVCVKPAGVISQCDGARDMTVLLREQCGGGIYPVHRLDREVGGVMVFARDAKAAAALSAQIQEGKLIKRYWAVVEGRPDPPEGELRDILFKDSKRGKTFVVSRPRKGTKEARLEYECLETAQGERGEYTLVKIRLYTGRTHQIRVQFASRKMPLLGDGKYGSHERGCRVALWSQGLEFVNPADGRPLRAECPPDGSVYPWNRFEGE